MAFPCIRGHHIHDGILNSESIVLDLGGHKGEFSSIISNQYHCTCHVIEAMPALYASIPKTQNIHTYHYAASDKDGMMSFHLSSNPESNSLIRTNDAFTSTIEVPTISIPSFLHNYGIPRIDALKMDIEGAEIAVFRGMSDDLLKSIKQITVEFHDFIPEMKMEQDVLDIISRMKSLGFACIVFSRKTHFDVLFLNTTCIGFWDIVLARTIKYIHGFQRVFKRLFN
ncbi:MAG: FkbM family methyltransferase [Ignavibacteria bacterium]